MNHLKLPLVIVEMLWTKMWIAVKMGVERQTSLKQQSFSRPVFYGTLLKDLDKETSRLMQSRTKSPFKHQSNALFHERI